MALLKKLEIGTRVHKKAIILFLGLFLISITVEIWTSNRLATYGAQIVQLDKATDSLNLENELLADQIAERSSLQYAQKIAPSLGFGPSSHLEYIHR